MKSIKRAFLLILAVACVISTVPFTATAAEGQATTAEGWTAISTAEQFLNIKDDTDGYYYLTNDIDFTGVTRDSSAYLVSEFGGILEGNGHSIYGFALEATGDATVTGVFGTALTTVSPIIRNLSIGQTGAPVSMTVSVSGQNDAGFIVGTNNGDCNKVIAENVDIYGTVRVSAFTGTARIGGAIGKTRGALLDDVSFEGSITVADTVTAGNINIGGFIGVIPGASDGGGMSVVKSCNATATVTSADSSTDSKYFGGFVGNCLDSILIRDCTAATVTASGATVGNAIGRKENSAAVVIKDCGAFDDAAPLVGSFKSGADAYFYAYDKTSGSSTAVTEITDEAGLLAIKDAPTGIYRLKNSIELKKSFDNYVIDADFAGILDGNGCSVYGFSIAGDQTTKGFFKSISNSTSADSAIIDLTLGSATSKVAVTHAATTESIIGVLAAKAGAGTYGAIISGVTVFAEISSGMSGTRASYIGGLCGAVYSVTVDSCTANGSITVTEGAGNKNDNVGGIAGWNGKKDGTCFIDCTNLATVQATGEVTSKRRFGGILGLLEKSVDFIGCNNFGAIVMPSAPSTTYYSGGGGIIGMENVVTRTSVIECNNFGSVTANAGTPNSVCGVASGIMGAGKNSFVMDGCKQLGEIRGAASTNVWSTHSIAGSTLAINQYACEESAVVSMKNGASVRLGTPTGIRFSATCDAELMDIVKSVFGESNISYGTIIAPNAFVQGTGIFTHEALDKYAEDNEFGDIPAYVDVASDARFDGKAGQIAGSLTGLDSSMYGTAFTGRAYVKCVLDGVTYIFYADNVCVRTIKEVSEKALADLLYKKDGAYYKYESGSYVAYTGDKAELYDNTVETNSDGYEVLSPYTVNDRNNVLSKFAQ